MSLGAVHRGDLLRALATPGVKIPEHAAARLCGFDWEPEAVDQPVDEPEFGSQKGESKTVSETSKAADISPSSGEQLRFWCTESVEWVSDAEAKRLRQTPPAIATAPILDTKDLQWSERPLSGKPLVKWSRLWPFLHEILGRRRSGRAPDLRRLLHQVARGKALVRIPRRTRRAWHPQVQIWLDRRLGLAPFWDDFDDLLRRLVALRGSAGLDVFSLELSTRNPNQFVASRYPPERFIAVPTLDAGEAPSRVLRLPGTAACVLVLGDLGQLEGGLLTDPWLRLGRRLRARDITPWALCPCPRSRWLPTMARTWEAVAWDRGQPLPRGGHGQSAQPRTHDERTAESAVKLANLLPLVAPAIRVERGLLRDLRHLLPSGEADAGTEYDAFEFSGATGSSLGVTLQADQVQSLRARLAALPTEHLHNVVRLLRRHHAYCANVFGHMEVLGLHDVLKPSQWDGLLEAGVLPPDALDSAREFWRSFVHTLASGRFASDGTAAFGGRDWARLRGQARANEEMQAVWALANAAHDRELPESVQPEAIAWLGESLPTSQVRVIGLDGGMTIGDAARIRIAQLESDAKTCFVTLLGPDGERLRPPRELDWEAGGRISPPDLGMAAGVVIQSGPNRVRLGAIPRPYWATRSYYDGSTLVSELDLGDDTHHFIWRDPSSEQVPARVIAHRSTAHWTPKTKPSWAQRWWVDSKGVAAELFVGGTRFVLRCIPPGKFRMGSPEDEASRWDHEGPQHEVELTRGFWLGETPVTQAQWRTVVEAMPRRWFDTLLGKKAPLKPAPSHFSGADQAPVENVSWEECLAFASELTRLTNSALVFGLPSEAQWEYACRAGTDGAFGDGSDCTQPAGKDPALERLGWYGENSENRTHTVKEKGQNGWGLHDMHGNVWEWCRDGLRTYREGAEVDPEGEVDARDGRVVRGGSSFSPARVCRAACRRGFEPEGRVHLLGFRLAAGLKSGGAERQEDPERRSRGAERPKGPTSRPQPPRKKK